MTRPSAEELLKRARATATTHGFAGLDTAIVALARAHQLRLGPARTTIDGDEALSVRELEVLRLVATGKSNPDIAETLFISRRTAAAHVSNILRKLDATSQRRSRLRGSSTRRSSSCGSRAVGAASYSVKLARRSGDPRESSEGHEGGRNADEARFHSNSPFRWARAPRYVTRTSATRVGNS